MKRENNMQVLLPEGWPRPQGYSNGIAAEGKLIFVAGQVGWNANCEFETDDLAGQTRQALANVVDVLNSAGASAGHIVRLTWYATNKEEYMANRAAVGIAYREVMGRHYPAMSLVFVESLLEDRAKVEIEATAVVSHN